MIVIHVDLGVRLTSNLFPLKENIEVSQFYALQHLTRYNAEYYEYLFGSSIINIPHRS